MRTRHLIGNVLRNVANQVDPPPVRPPLTYETSLPMTEAAAKALAKMISHELGGQICIAYIKPDGRPARYN